MTRNSVLLAALISLTTVLGVRAAEPEVLPLQLDPKGAPVLGVIFSASNSMLYATMAWSGPALLGPKAFTNLKVAFYDTAAKKRLTDWQDYDGPRALYPGSMATNRELSGAPALATISKLRSLALVFSLDEAETADGEYPITALIDLGAECAKSPASFKNLDTGADGCI